MKTTIEFTLAELNELTYVLSQGYGAGEIYTDKAQPNTGIQHNSYIRAYEKIIQAKATLKSKEKIK